MITRVPAKAARRAVAAAASLVRAAILLCLFGVPAFALTPIVVAPDQERIEITTLGEAYEGRGDSLQVETAAGADGVSGRMTVRASTPGANPNWMVFALTNSTDKQLERWLTADRYTIIGSGTIWPDLDARRVESVTPSIGFVPERIKSDRADVFRITLEPGQTITYVAELSSERYARLFLWKPIDYEVKSRDRQLFNGAMLGLTGLLAIFLTAVFAANHKVIFPAAALVSWTVLTYLCVDFGFFHKLFNLRPEDNAVYRAAGEAGMAASMVIFLSTFLRLGLWHGIVRMLIGVWMIAQVALVAVAVVDPRLAATFARLSFVVVGALGAVFTLFLALRGQDRALSLIPTWVLFLVWIFAAGMTLSGRLTGDMMVSSLAAGIVLVVILLGFTVTQFAFRSLDPVYAGAPTELQSRSLAISGSGSSVWEWNIRRDEIKVGTELETALALMPGELSAKVDDFAKHMHPMDQERFRVMLVSAQERAGVRIRTDFRMRHADNSWRWFDLEAASVPNADGRTLRCVGLVRDITNSKRAYERLLHDAVHCSLTGLPNRELFLDRLRTSAARAKTESGVRPSVIFIDLDKFKSVNSTFGLVRGDSMLLTVARRLQRHLGPHDTVARVGGDQFAMLFLSEEDARNVAALAERVRRSLRAPIPLANQEIVLTGSIGVAVWDNNVIEDGELLKEAELAMYRAKRSGADRIVAFDPAMRRDRDDRIQIESDLRKAIERNQLKVLYQPIVYLPTKELAGFEALVRWEHPKLGLLNPVSFVPVAEESDLIIKLGSHVLLRAAKDAARWQSELPRAERPLFVSVNVSSRQILRPDGVQEIRHILGRNIVPRGGLRLEITETLVMENPEQSAEVLEMLRSAGADLALDDFGTGYSSLAYLQRFPFDTIKIDRELVRGSSSPQGAAIMRSIVALAHELGKRVVSEGVEHKEEASFLRTIGCEYAQGYHFGEPIPERDVLQLLKVIRKSERKMQPRGFFRAKLADRRIAPPRPGAKPDAMPSATEAMRSGVAAAVSKAHMLANATVRHRHRATPVSEALAREVGKSPPAPLAPPSPLTPPILAESPVSANAMGQKPAAAPPFPVAPSLPNSKFETPRTAGRPSNGGASGNGREPPMRTAAIAVPKTLPPPMVPPPQVPLPAPAASMPPLPLGGAANGRAAPAAPGTPGTPRPVMSAPPLTAPPMPTQPNQVVTPLSEALARATMPRAPANGKAAMSEGPVTGPPTQPVALPPVYIPPPDIPAPDLSSLPPGVAASLARLAGVKPTGPAKPDEPPKSS